MGHLMDDGRLSIADCFARVCKRGMVAAIAFVTIMAFFWVATPTPAPAQYMGSVSQASTVSPVSNSAAISIPIAIGTCTASVTSNCIRMIGQVAHELILNYTGAGGPSGTSCRVLLDGSADGVNWFTMAQAWLPSNAPAYGNDTATLYADAYYPLIQIVVDPPAANSCAGLTGTYLGFQTPVSLPSWPYNSKAQVASATQLGYASAPALDYVLQAFQCTNLNSSTAFLNIADFTGTPALSNYFYQIAIPAGATFNYASTAGLIVGVATPWAGAFTTATGTSPVTTALSCDFQINYAGPFIPSPLDTLL